MKSNAKPVRYVEDGLLFDDGSLLKADVIVFATGFQSNLRMIVENLFGPEVASKSEDYWGLDPEGEVFGAFKPQNRKRCFVRTSKDISADFTQNLVFGIWVVILDMLVIGHVMLLCKLKRICLELHLRSFLKHHVLI